MSFKSFQRKLNGNPVKTTSKNTWLPLSCIPVHSIQLYKTIYHQVLTERDKYIYIPLRKEGIGYIDDLSHPEYPREDMEKFNICSWSIAHPLSILIPESLFVKAIN